MAKIDLYDAITRASVEVAATKLPGDHGKWAAYLKLSKDDQLQWRKNEGHAEFARLQRLSFHCHLRGSK